MSTQVVAAVLFRNEPFQARGIILLLWVGGVGAPLVLCTRIANPASLEFRVKLSKQSPLT